MTDIFPPDLTASVGRVRKYVPDLIQLDDPRDPGADPAYYFTDAEIESYVAEYTYGSTDRPKRSQIKRAAADVIDALANNEALVLKKIKTEDLETDGPATANSLRNGAKALRQQAAEEEIAEGQYVVVVPFIHHHPQTRLPRRMR